MNVSAEAIAQKESFLYHEDRGIWGGLLGRVKPITLAIYGNYEVLAMFGNFSPLDIAYEDREDWDAAQWGAYSRVVLLAFKSYINPDNAAAPTVISRAFGEMEHSLFALSRADNYSGPYRKSLGYGRVESTVRLIRDSLKALQDLGENHPIGRLSWGRPFPRATDVYDLLADLTFKLILNVARIEGSVARVEGSVDLWSIWHNSIWGELIESIGDETEVKRVFLARIFRLIKNEIASLKTSPNYQNGPLLGFCLTLLGVDGPVDKHGFRSETAQLTLWLRSWTRRNFRALYEGRPNIAGLAMIGPLSYESGNHRVAYAHKNLLLATQTMTYLVVV